MATVLIGGGSGLVGSRLSQLLTEKGYTVWHLSRSPGKDDPYRTFAWDTKKGYIDQSAVEGADYVVNLAGAGIADKRWTDKRKQLIIDSRVETTQLLQRAIQSTTNAPRAYISASAAGYYGDRDDQILSETDPPGDGFLSASCIAWEKAAAAVSGPDLRNVIIRIGIVLTTEGGALPKMTMPVNFFAGVYFGNGRQWMPWIHINDLCRVFIYAIEQDKMAGIYNGVGPNPERNRDFIDSVAEARNKPVVMLPAPAFVLKLALGEMSHALLDSTRASAEKLAGAGFSFEFPKLREALLDLYGKRGS
ncbi:MAG: TIGR01777 family oxidoreductase [Saprospiraceae bacterium]|nr:TIGR01777 family oxidoreductase [Lewinella sp.]